MLRIACVLASSLVLMGCPGVGSTVIADPAVAHEVAEEITVVGWCHLPDGRWARCTMVAGPGWWLLSPEVVAKTKQR
jgi:hypothetical protein